MRREAMVAAWVGLQLLFFAGWALLEEARFDEGEGRSILVTVTPVDPRDPLRGQFMQLGYRFSLPQEFAGGPTEPDGAEVWVVLRPDGLFHVPDAAYHRRPEVDPGQVALRGRLARGRYVFGIERYFVPEGTETPDWRDLTVRLRVGGDGRARLEEVYLRGDPWP